MPENHMASGQKRAALSPRDAAAAPTARGTSPNATSPAKASSDGTEARAQARVSTGISGLDIVLYGGLIPQRAYLVRGGPGSGKTTLGLHFLTDGARRGEQCLFITLGEPEGELRANATALGFDLTNIHFLDLSPSAAFFAEMQAYDIFWSSPKLSVN